MGINYIKDKRGQVVAQERDNLIQRNGETLARFDKGTNTTKGVDGKVEGFGDQRKVVLGKKLGK